MNYAARCSFDYVIVCRTVSTAETVITTRSAYTGSTIYMTSKSSQQKTFESVVTTSSDISTQLEADNFKTQTDESVVIVEATEEMPIVPRSSCADLVLTEPIPEGETMESVTTALSAAFAASVSTDFKVNITIATQEKSFTAEGYVHKVHIVHKIEI